jgi:hypothetical protein
MGDPGEGAVEPRHQRRIGTPAQHLGDEGTARHEHLASEVRRRIAEPRDAQVVGRRVPGRRRRHVGDHHIRLPAQPGAHLRIRPVGEKVQHAQLDPGDRLDLLQVEPKHAAHRLAALAAECVHPRHRYLAPAARCCAEVHHPRARNEKAEPVVDAGELVGRPAAIALGARPRHEGVIQLPLQPAGRGYLSPLGGLDAHPQVTAAAAGSRRAGR